MTFAAIDWLNISINLLLVVFFIVCIMMVLLILMQRPKQEGLGAAFGTNVTDQVFGARTTNVLQRGTVYLGSLFFILSLALAILIGQRNKAHTLIDKTAVHAPAPVIETTPEKQLADQLKALTAQPVPAGEVAPATPAAPVVPAVPVEAPAAPAAPDAPEAPKVETPAAPAGEPAPPAGGEKPAGQ